MMNRRSLVAICLAFVLALTGQSMAVARGSTDATGQMVLCVGTESVLVYVDANGEPTQAPHFCPDCTISLVDASPAATADAPYRLLVVPYISMAYIAAQSDVVIYAYLSRGPPALI